MSKKNEIKLPPLKDSSSRVAEPQKEAMDASAVPNGSAPKVWNWMSVRNRPKIMEPESKLPSQTIPGQDMTIEQILQRYMSGQTVNTQNSLPVYLDGLITPAVDTMDKAEKFTFFQDAMRKLDNAEKAIKIRNAEAESTARLAEIQALKDEIAKQQLQLSGNTSISEETQG